MYVRSSIQLIWAWLVLKQGIQISCQMCITNKHDWNYVHLGEQFNSLSTFTDWFIERLQNSKWNELAVTAFCSASVNPKLITLKSLGTLSHSSFKREKEREGQPKQKVQKDGEGRDLGSLWKDPVSGKVYAILLVFSSSCEEKCC